MNNYPVVSYNDVMTQSSLYVPQTLHKDETDILSPVSNKVEEGVSQKHISSSNRNVTDNKRLLFQFPGQVSHFYYGNMEKKPKKLIYYAGYKFFSLLSVRRIM